MSRLPFEILLALRYLRPKRTFVSVITLISVVGVTLGVAVLIIVISVMTGFDRQLRDKILGFNAHLRVVRAGASMLDYRTGMDIIGSNTLVKAVAPYVEGQVLLETLPEMGTSVVIAPVIRGIDAKVEEKGGALPKSIVQGSFNVKGNGIMLGQALATRLRVRPGDRVAIYSIRELKRMNENYRRNREKGGVDEVALPTEYEVRGIFNVGFFDFDNYYVLCSLQNAQDLYDMGDAVHGLMVNLHDPSKAHLVRDQLLPEFSANVEITTWEDENAGILDALAVERNVMFYLLFFIMIVAAFGITSTLITFVVQKTREIGLLKAIGATSAQIMWIFLGQSLIVGVLGVSCGLGLGTLAVAYRNEFLRFLRQTTGMELFPAKVYFFTELPAHIEARDVLLICGGSMLICILAGLFPAWNAGRLKPVEALRHE